MATVLISHPSCSGHETGPFHPESPQRLDVINDRLLEIGVLDLLMHRQAPAASREQLLRVHKAEHLEQLESARPDSGLVYLDPDTPISPGSLEAAYHAAGAVVLATDMVLGGTSANAFCNVRPPGHHASADHAMGFCLFNNVAVGAAHAIEQHGLERVAILDFDVHHGNGTDLIFAQNPSVRVFSVFQKDLYPFGTGLYRSGLGIDLALPPASGGDAMRDAVSEFLLPRMHEFKPELIYISAGFDAHIADDVADLCYTDADFDWLTRQALEVANTHSNGRLISSLEGGYELSALARCAANHIRLLAGI